MGISIDIYEDTFVKKSTSSYNLSALVGADRFSFLVVDQLQQKVQLLKSYKAGKNAASETKTFLHDVYAQDQILNANYRQIVLGIQDAPSTLIPKRLFDPSQIQVYFEKQVPAEDGQIYLYDDLSKLDMVLAYRINQGLDNLLKGYFPNALVEHMDTMYLKGVHQLATHRNSYQIYLNVIGTKFHLVLFEGAELLFSNRYEFKTAEDFIYYTMLIFDQFKLKPESVPLYLSGEITETSTVYRLLYRYIRHLHFMQLPTFLNFGPQVQKQLHHQFFNLYCTKLCVL